MGNDQGKPNFKELSKGTKFTSKELSSFFDKFKKDFPDGKITKDQFTILYKKMFGVDGDATEFCELTFKQYDKDNSGTIDFKEFMMTLSVASRGTPDEKLLWAFHLYDKDGNGYLTESEIREVLTAVYKARSKPAPQESAARVAADIMKQADDNKDGRLSEAEFLYHAARCEEVQEMLSTL